MNYTAMIESCYKDWNRTRPAIMAVDTETTGVLWQSDAFCFTVAWDTEEGVVSHFIDLDHVDERQRPRLIRMLYTTDLLVFHNAKFDLNKLVLSGLLDEHGITYRKIADTMIQAHLLDERRSIRLKDLAREELGESTDEEEVLKKVRRELKLKKDDGYHALPRDVLVPYALKDAEYTLRLYNRFHKQIKARGLAEKEQMEYRLVRVVIDMEAKGLAVDVPYVEQQIKKLGSEIYRIKKEIQEITGRKVFEEKDLEPREGETKKAAKERADAETFNPNSPAQVLKVFDDLYGIKLEGTSKDALYGVDAPLADALLRLRDRMKMRGTYLLAIRDEHDHGILHPSFRLTGTRTGRFSSGLGE